MQSVVHQRALIHGRRLPILVGTTQEGSPSSCASIPANRFFHHLWGSRMATWDHREQSVCAWVVICRNVQVHQYVTVKAGHKNSSR